MHDKNIQNRTENCITLPFFSYPWYPFTQNGELGMAFSEYFSKSWALTTFYVAWPTTLGTSALLHWIRSYWTGPCYWRKLSNFECERVVGNSVLLKYPSGLGSNLKLCTWRQLLRTRRLTGGGWWYCHRSPFWTPLERWMPSFHSLRVGRGKGLARTILSFDKPSFAK